MINGFKIHKLIGRFLGGGSLDRRSMMVTGFNECPIENMGGGFCPGPCVVVKGGGRGCILVRSRDWGWGWRRGLGGDFHPPCGVGWGGVGEWAGSKGSIGDQKS